MQEKHFYVYIMSNKINGTLYVGVTSDLLRRIAEHKEGIKGDFTKKYGLKTLVYYESCGDAEHAILREKKIKK